MMKTIEILFWIALAIVFILMQATAFSSTCWYGSKRRCAKEHASNCPKMLPEVTLLIAAYNEEAVIADKMRNCRALDYPGRPAENRLGDGRFERPHERIASRISGSHGAVCTRTARQNAALNRGVPLVTTPLVVFTDANTMLGPEAIREILGPSAIRRSAAWQAKRGSYRAVNRRPHRPKVSTGKRIEAQRMGRPPLYGRRSRRRAVRDPPRTVRSDAGRYAGSTISSSRCASRCRATGSLTAKTLTRSKRPRPT